eukprot:7388683-Prymnesium_polylepis.1
MAGVLSIYGLIIAVMIGTSIPAFSPTSSKLFSDYSMHSAFAHFFAGVTCGWVPRAPSDDERDPRRTGAAVSALHPPPLHTRALSLAPQCAAQ